jgi:hypothetical protein
VIIGRVFTEIFKGRQRGRTFLYLVKNNEGSARLNGKARLNFQVPEYTDGVQILGKSPPHPGIMVKVDICSGFVMLRAKVPQKPGFTDLPDAVQYQGFALVIGFPGQKVINEFPVHDSSINRILGKVKKKV